MADSEILFPGCSLSQYVNGSCGTCSAFPGETYLILVKSCDKSIEAHLRKCKTRHSFVKNECDLVCLRAGIWNYDNHLDEGITICPFHRYTYGVGWHFSKMCRFFIHSEDTKAKAQIGMDRTMCMSAQLRWGVLHRVGTGVYL